MGREGGGRGAPSSRSVPRTPTAEGGGNDEEEAGGADANEDDLLSRFRELGREEQQRLAASMGLSRLELLAALDEGGAEPDEKAASSSSSSSSSGRNSPAGRRAALHPFGRNGAAKGAPSLRPRMEDEEETHTSPVAATATAKEKVVSHPPSKAGDDWD